MKGRALAAALATAALVTASAVATRRCGRADADALRAEARALERDLAAAEEALRARDAEYAAEEAAHAALISGLNDAIDGARARAAELGGADRRLADAVASLERAEAEAAGNADLVVNLRAQVSVWKERFGLAQEALAAKDEIIFSVTQQYEGERGLRVRAELDRDSWRKQYFEMKALAELNGRRAEARERSARLARYENWAWRLIVVAGVIHGAVGG